MRHASQRKSIHERNARYSHERASASHAGHVRGAQISPIGRWVGDLPGSPVAVQIGGSGAAYGCTESHSVNGRTAGQLYA
jgi:hypothetical protein